jgi:hypothetical protein
MGHRLATELFEFRGVFFRFRLLRFALSCAPSGRMIFRFA